MLIDPNAPYVLLVVGLFIGLTCAISFNASLRQKVKEWSGSRSTRALAELQGFRLLLPYSGICLGSCMFLAAILETFNTTRPVSYAIAIPLTLIMGFLVWWQLRQLLKQLEAGNKRLDFDRLL